MCTIFQVSCTGALNSRPAVKGDGNDAFPIGILEGPALKSVPSRFSHAGTDLCSAGYSIAQSAAILSASAR